MYPLKAGETGGRSRRNMIDARSNQNSKEKRLDPRTRNATQELGGGGEREAAPLREKTSQ